MKRSFTEKPLPIDVDLTLAGYKNQLEDQIFLVSYLHDTVPYIKADGKTLYTRVWLRYIWEGLTKTLNSITELEKHLQGWETNLTAIIDQGKALGFPEAWWNEDGTPKNPMPEIVIGEEKSPKPVGGYEEWQAKVDRGEI